MNSSQRKDYVESIKSKMNKWRSIIEELQYDVDRGDPSTDADNDMELNDLRSHLEDIEELVRNLEEVSDEEWEDLQEELEEELEIFETSLHEARDEIDDV